MGEKSTIFLSKSSVPPWQNANGMIVLHCLIQVYLAILNDLMMVIDFLQYTLILPPFEGKKVRTNGKYEELDIGGHDSDEVFNYEDFVLDDTIY